MSRETVLVAYDPSLRESTWLRQTLEMLVAPLCQTSILLVDTELHPVLAERWANRAVVRYDVDGYRYLRGVRQKQWAPPEYEKADTKDAHEIHAFALQLALRSAHAQDYTLRSFIFPGPLLIGASVHHALEASRDALLGEVTILREPRPSSTAGLPLVWVDTETTGLSAQKHTVIEIAATLTDSNGECAEAEFDARCPIPEWAEVTPIALEVNQYHVHPRWKDHTTHEDMVRSFHAWLPKGQFKLAGQNVPFDRSFLDAAFRRYNLELPNWRLPAVDTRPISDQILKKRGLITNNKLETVARYFDLHTRELHGARYDINVTREVYRRLKEIVRHQDEGQSDRAVAE